MKQKTIFSLLFAALSFIIIGCTPTVSTHGNMLEDYQIEEIKVGESTRSDILRTFGSPTSKSTFDPLVWYYIGQTKEKRGILDPEVVDEKIYLVAFSDEGVLKALQKIDRERMNIPYARNKTPTHGNETTIMQQFLGNLGKFNPQQAE